MRKSKNNANKGTGEPQAVTRVRVPRKDKNEVLATVVTLMGGSRVKLHCMDGNSRMGRIPGSKKKRMWVREGDIVIAEPWNVQDSKADIVWKYTRPQVDWLDRKGYLQR
ncbi:translation initiation factor eIF-1A [Methanosalsum natronophilum]|uniref:translation initiation factor eIF-1A n=1 Tax=Methanosalsum natronophilum TaxID=768733 RepID=UPI00216A3C1C|nr:translation initiation factor eIF-1A [Methanosalsum natronophilum]MCS3924688.1 translation initiation factor 1A [Methanosalsum natronophilum]